MPIGCYSLVPTIADQLSKRGVSSVLDLGIGMGLYGSVVRQWCDLGVMVNGKWRTRLVGVEGWSGYRNPLWEIYDYVFECSIEEAIGGLTDQWDAILLMDVLEHFEKPAGEHLITAIRRRLRPDGRFYIGTPAVWMEQGAVYGNEFERHRSLWTIADLQRLDCEILIDGRSDAFGNQMLLAVAPPLR